MKKANGLRGYEDGGSLPMARFYAGTSELGTSSHALPESMPVEMPDAELADDVSGSGVFAEAPNNNLDLGMFADAVSLPGYAARETGFGPSETIDWQTGEHVAVFASGITNNIADGGVFPLGRGPRYLPNDPRMADTDFTRPGLPVRSIANDDGVLRQRVPGARDITAAVARLRPINAPAPEVAPPGSPGDIPQTSTAGYHGYGAYARLDRPRGLTTAQRLMQRQLVPVGKPGVADVVVTRFARTPQPALGAFELPQLPLWQWALVGIGVGTVVGAAAAVMFPKKG